MTRMFVDPRRRLRFINAAGTLVAASLAALFGHFANTQLPTLAPGPALAGVALGIVFVLISGRVQRLANRSPTIAVFHTGGRTALRRGLAEVLAPRVAPGYHPVIALVDTDGHTAVFTHADANGAFGYARLAADGTSNADSLFLSPCERKRIRAAIAANPFAIELARNPVPDHRVDAEIADVPEHPAAVRARRSGSTILALRLSEPG